MAKQTFTTGQVLTAAQMTSLQQTAMLGGDASVKTASYVLVAADAGTTVAMNAAGSTTITVNTGLFSAGDIVFIQNRGAGNCTVTAGTATVATAGSLILPQNDAGILYFTSASAAIFYDFIQTGATSPLTTKGDLYTYSTSDARLPVGTNGYYLSADSAETTGLKWVAPAAGGFVGCRLKKSGGTNQNISHATTTTITFDAEDFDTDGFHDNSTNNTRITIPSGKGGKYLFTATGHWADNTTGSRQMYFRKNGTDIVAFNIWGADGAVGFSLPQVVELVATDYIELVVYQDSTVTLAVEGAYLFLSATYLGA